MSLLKVLKNAEESPLSDSDLRHIVQNDELSVIPYHELPKYSNLEECFNGLNCFILLLESNYNSGHYVAIVYNPKVNELSFNDSYGLTHNNLILKLDYYTHKDNGQYFFHRLKNDFINRYGCKYVENGYQYQYKSGEVNTCGRYAAFRCLMYYMPMNKYNRDMKELMDKLRLQADDLISILTLINTLG